MPRAFRKIKSPLGCLMARPFSTRLYEALFGQRSKNLGTKPETVKNLIKKIHSPMIEPNLGQDSITVMRRSRTLIFECARGTSPTAAGNWRNLSRLSRGLVFGTVSKFFRLLVAFSWLFGHPLGPNFGPTWALTPCLVERPI